MNIVHVLEAGMLVCFGISWPFNIAKSLRSRTAKGKSVAVSYTHLTLPTILRV